MLAQGALHVLDICESRVLANYFHFIPASIVHGCVVSFPKRRKGR